MFQEELIGLPWKAREKLLDKLIETGSDVCRRYTPEERVIQLPCQKVKGLVPYG
jgi:hypothetical protein